MRLTLKLAAVCALVAASSSVPMAARFAPTMLAPALTSVGPLAFGTDGTLYLADPQAATIFALDLGAQGAGATAGTAAVPGLDAKIAAILGTAADTLTITDLAVHPVSHNSFVSVMRGQGTAAQPALLRIDGAGKIDLVSMDTVKFTSVALPNPAAVSTTGRGGRTQSVTDMALVNGRLYVAGLSNEEFASKLWSVAYPFAKADNGTSIEIYHGNHGQFETRSPVMTFLPYTVSGQQYLVAGYTCTPLVRFPITGLSAGQKIVGTTMMDLGAGNQPIDMVSYSKGGQDMLLIANSKFGVIKVPTAQFATLPSITAKVDTAGAFEPITAMPDVQQLDKLDAQRVVTIALANGSRSLLVSQLP
ncbi:MAG: hypothetical protein ABI652_05870 [Acidobacteriota bacterium]